MPFCSTPLKARAATMVIRRSSGRAPTQPPCTMVTGSSLCSPTPLSSDSAIAPFLPCSDGPEPQPRTDDPTLIASRATTSDCDGVLSRGLNYDYLGVPVVAFFCVCGHSDRTLDYFLASLDNLLRDPSRTPLQLCAWLGLDADIQGHPAYPSVRGGRSRVLRDAHRDGRMRVERSAGIRPASAAGDAGRRGGVEAVRTGGCRCERRTLWQGSVSGE